MLQFTFYEEAAFPAAHRFLEGWMSAAAPALAQLLGPPVNISEPVQVFLSPTETHSSRFPVRASEVLQLIDDDQLDSDAERDEEGLLGRFPTEAYAHGVATLAGDTLRLPPSARAGEPAIFLDLQRIETLAARLDVPFEALLGRTAVHELSHVVRGHVTDNPGVTHGYVREGDAQRDTWQVLADLLADPFHARMARNARTAQIRLAELQPSAYRRFGHASPDRHISASASLEEPDEWVILPARDLLPLTREPIIEVPLIMTLAALGTPVEGDEVYLLGEGLIVGPWIVVDRTQEPYRPHPADVRAIETRQGKSDYRYLHLRPAPKLMATADVPLGASLGRDAMHLAKRIGEADMSALKDRFELAEPVLNAVAERLQRAVDEAGEEMRVLMAAHGQLPPQRLSYDPFRDRWQ